MHYSVVKRCWKEAVSVDVIDKESALIFRDKTKQFIDSCVDIILNGGDLFVSDLEDDFFEKEFYEKWVISDAKSLIFIEGEKIKNCEGEIHPSIFDDYNDFLDQWGKIPEAYNKIITEEDKEKGIYSSFDGSFLSNYFFSVSINMPLEAYFFKESEQEHYVETPFGLRKEYVFSVQEEKKDLFINFSNSLFYFLIDRASNDSENIYSGTSYEYHDENILVDLFSSILEKQDLMEFTSVGNKIDKKSMRF